MTSCLENSQSLSESRNPQKVRSLTSEPELVPTLLDQDLLQIWDFSTSFSEYLEIKPFRIEDLLAGLTYSGPEEVGLISDLISAFCDCLVWDIHEEEADNDETLLWMLKRYSEEKIQVFWPEILRILIQSSTFDFEASESVRALAERLQLVTPETFAQSFTKEEKVELMLFLVNTAKDLDGFRQTLSDKVQ